MITGRIPRMVTEELVQVWRDVIQGDEKSWVLFENGTCVILMEPEDDLAAQAVELLREYGPVAAGSSAGDFGTIDLDAAPGWAVYGHHNDILTYVAPEETADGANDLAVGLLGRSKRDQDGRELAVVHVEDKRPR
ncbi:hypothetical protein [Actinomadura madurae]|uniref:hypothetical protein n=1 Tax=Actinomadura madurae TaxID=1993 RepID=UPI0020D25EE2|nr:hypothetical protein [Actinomadura madurae]MCP9950410.1 hypothetical protein [Actinomadura madurae]MCP9967191.1 hypothetical protein [Actinomadura madurae]MCP9979654.1 hypothetical protein [Actinomadura madurae]MCQ0008816.1 hypothetical protein [Actinomadura madurae]MCQ0015869.1 hypothetical protein [Actinomadura madurae]